MEAERDGLETSDRSLERSGCQLRRETPRFYAVCQPLAPCRIWAPSRHRLLHCGAIAVARLRYNLNLRVFSVIHLSLISHEREGIVRN